MRFFTFVFLLFSISLTAQVQDVENVIFESDQAEISLESQKQLQDFAHTMLSSLDYEVNLQGHTDSDGSNGYNEALSARRSAAIKSYLIQQGLSKENITVSNYGERHPMATNDDEMGKQQNRRVEINYSHEPIAAVSDLFEYFENKRAQHFTRSAKDKQVISCQDGSVVIIPADAFTYQDGRPIGDVEYDLVVDEAIKTSTMFQYRLNTAHADGSLSTGGMIKLTAKVGDEELLLREGKSINISIPTAAVDPSMQLYRGERAENELMGWDNLPEPVEILDAPPIDHAGVEFPVELLSMLDDIDVEVPEFPGKLRDASIPALAKKPEPLTPKMKKPFKPGVPTRQIAERPKNIFQRVGFDLEKEQATLDARYDERMANYTERMKNYETAMIAYQKNQKAYNAEMAIINKQFEIDKQSNYELRMQAIKKHIEKCYAYEAAQMAKAQLDEFQKDLSVETIDEKLFPSDRIKKNSFVFKISLKSLDYFAQGKSLPYGESADLSDYYREAINRSEKFKLEVGIAQRLNEMKQLYKTYSYANAKALKEKNAATFANLNNSIQYYNFNITDPVMYWCNIDTPTPIGIEFVQFENSQFSELFTFRPTTKVVNYFPTNMKKEAVYPTNMPVDYLAFKFDEKGLGLATGTFKARSKVVIDMEYRQATLPEIERAIARMDG